MTKMLLNTGSVPLYDIKGAPIPPGAIVLDDELDPSHEALVDDGTLVYVRPSSLPEDVDHVSAAAQEHASGNAEAAVRDDAAVQTTPKAKGGQS